MTQPDDDIELGEGAITEEDQQRVIDYWTPERMRDAQPLPLERDAEDDISPQD